MEAAARRAPATHMIGGNMAGRKPYCRALSDWEVEQAYVDWNGGEGKRIPLLADELHVNAVTVKRAFKRLEERRAFGDDAPDREPEPEPEPEHAPKPKPKPEPKPEPCTLALTRRMPDGTEYRLELGMRADAVRLFMETVLKVMA